MKINYEWTTGSFAGNEGSEYYNDLLNQCSNLYSTQYGKWSKVSPHAPGKRVKLSPNKIREWLVAECSSIYFAKDGKKLVGYAIAIQLQVPKYGIISWVTQLVVHEKYRHKDIAKNLLRSIWGFTDHFAWGIVSASPYAVRALEKATRRRSDPVRIKYNLQKILSIGAENVPYINSEIETLVNNEISRINTAFFVDHSNVEQMIDDVVTDAVPWALGSLEEGWEWLAFTFQDQLPFELSKSEIMEIVNLSDNIAKNAYKRMDMSSLQTWAKNSKSEVSFIERECCLKQGDYVIDFGCGQGRHSVELAKDGIFVTGVDYVDKNIETANKRKEKENLTNLLFIEGDCRSISVKENADAVICLYDVIGTFSDNKENIKILENIAKHLKPGGTAIISVMNYELTNFQAKNKFVFDKNPQALLTLKPSETMETTGNIFNPEYYLVDTDTRIVYRREQFKHGRALPVELIVQDRRFSKNEIENMCNKVGLHVELSRYVNAKSWEESLESTDLKSKEILLKCKKQK